jgi:hypothetical protein
MYSHILAVADENKAIYAMHDKIYFNPKQASNALKTMINSGKLSDHYKVYAVTSFSLKEITQ